MLTPAVSEYLKNLKPEDFHPDFNTADGQTASMLLEEQVPGDTEMLFLIPAELKLVLAKKIEKALNKARTDERRRALEVDPEAPNETPKADDVDIYKAAKGQRRLYVVYDLFARTGAPPSLNLPLSRQLLWDHRILPLIQQNEGQGFVSVWAASVESAARAAAQLWRAEALDARLSDRHSTVPLYWAENSVEAKLCVLAGWIDMAKLSAADLRFVPVTAKVQTVWA